MLNFAEQTGSGAVMIVWSFLLSWALSLPMNVQLITIHPTFHCIALCSLLPLVLLASARRRTVKDNYEQVR